MKVIDKPQLESLIHRRPAILLPGKRKEEERDSKLSFCGPSVKGISLGGDLGPVHLAWMESILCIQADVESLGVEN